MHLEKAPEASRRLPKLGPSRLSGRGRARHMVLVGPFPLLVPRLAGRDERPGRVAPYNPPRDGAGYPLLLGRQNGDVLSAAHGQAAVQGGLPACDGELPGAGGERCERRGGQDERVLTDERTEGRSGIEGVVERGRENGDGWFETTALPRKAYASSCNVSGG